MNELGTQAWLDAYQRLANDSATFETASAGWEWPMGLAFLAQDDLPTRLCMLDVADGCCGGARVVDQEEFDQAPFRISGTYDRWDHVLSGQLDPIKALMLRKLKLQGDLTTVIKYHDAAKELIRCAGTVEVGVS